MNKIKGVLFSKEKETFSIQTEEGDSLTFSAATLSPLLKELEKMYILGATQFPHTVDILELGARNGTPVLILQVYGHQLIFALSRQQVSEILQKFDLASKHLSHP